jgi:hypothetical protein
LRHRARSVCYSGWRFRTCPSLAKKRKRLKDRLPASFLPALAAAVRRALCGPIYPSTPSMYEDRITLAPST